MSKPYKPCPPEQDHLLPPSLGDWLPDRHLAYFASEVVREQAGQVRVKSLMRSLRRRVGADRRSEEARQEWLS
jgi:hypothetical protein